MSEPIIHLEEYFLEKLLVERRPPNASDIEYGQVSISFDFDYQIKRNPDDSSFFMLTFIVRDDPSVKTACPQAYNIDLRIIGVFRFNEDVEEDQMQYLIRFNGCTILYGILRGILSTITGTFPEGAIKLPTIMIDEVVKKIEERIQKENTNKLKRPKKKVAKKVTKLAKKKLLKSSKK